MRVVIVFTFSQTNKTVLALLRVDAPAGMPGMYMSH